MCGDWHGIKILNNNKIISSLLLNDVNLLLLSVEQLPSVMEGVPYAEVRIAK